MERAVQVLLSSVIRSWRQSGHMRGLYPAQHERRANRRIPRSSKANNPKRSTAMTPSSKPPARMKRLTLDLPESLHRAIKKNAAEEGVTMAQKLRAILTEQYPFTEEKS